MERVAATAGLGWADPWADRRLAEFVLAVPQDRVNRASDHKRLARKALAPLFPPGALDLTKKTIPDALWDRGFRDRERATVLSLIEESQAARRGYLNQPLLLQEYREYLRSGRVRYDWWWPLTLEAWMRRYWSTAS